MDAINKHGQGLLQSAPPGVSTSLLEADLESLNDKWSDLNERVSTWSALLCVLQLVPPSRFFVIENLLKFMILFMDLTINSQF